MSLLAAQARTRDRQERERQMAAMQSSQNDYAHKTVDTFKDTMAEAFRAMIAGIPKPDYSSILNAIKAIPKVDLRPVLAAIKAIPQPEKVDLAPVISAVKAIPKPDPVDFTQLMQRLDWLSTRIDSLERSIAAIDVNIPDIHLSSPTQTVVPQKTEWKFDITYNAVGGIKSITAK